MIPDIKPLLTYLAPFGTLSEEDQHAIQNYITYCALPQHHLLEQAGEIGKHYYFILQGAVRSYLLDEDGTETTFRFSFENSLEGSFDSLRTGKPASSYIELLEPCRLLVIHTDSLAQFLLTHPTVRQVVDKHNTYWVGKLADRLTRFRTMSATQKYAWIQQEYPAIVNRVPLSYIASYLGLRLETLSRIRAKRN